jgi:hypothetical protein
MAIMQVVAGGKRQPLVRVVKFHVVLFKVTTWRPRELFLVGDND